MNKLNPIAADHLLIRPHHLWSAQWLLLTAGDFAAGAFNTMAVGWGSFGTMWGKPFAQVVVRPGRHTRMIYWQDMHPANFLDPGIAKNYPQKDYHRIYFGEMLAVAGTEAFLHRP
jgi:hypothetical protein